MAAQIEQIGLSGLDSPSQSATGHWICYRPQRTERIARIATGYLFYPCLQGAQMEQIGLSGRMAAQIEQIGLSGWIGPAHPRRAHRTAQTGRGPCLAHAAPDRPNWPIRISSERLGRIARIADPPWHLPTSSGCSAVRVCTSLICKLRSDRRAHAPSTQET
jgi:hypothetical protein